MNLGWEERMEVLNHFMGGGSGEFHGGSPWGKQIVFNWGGWDLVSEPSWVAGNLVCVFVEGLLIIPGQADR